MFESPEEGAKVLGNVPKGSIVIAVGEQSGLFLKVELELKSGEKVDGWMDEKNLELEENAPLAPEEKEVKGFHIPKDEKDVLQRRETFYYGATVGGNYAIIQNSADTNVHSGLAGGMGGFLGLYLKPNLVLRLEGNYVAFNGVSPFDTLVLSFGIAETGAVVSYLIDRWELFGGAHYNWGLSLADVPVGITLNGPADVGGPALQAGVGYGIPLSRLFRLSLRARYVLSLTSSPFFFQGIGAFAALEVLG